MSHTLAAAAAPPHEPMSAKTKDGRCSARMESEDLLAAAVLNQRIILNIVWVGVEPT